MAWKREKGVYWPHPQGAGVTMALIQKLDAIEDLPRTPASDVKKLGWRGVMKVVGREGRVVVTNHSEPEAVILSIEDYGAIVRALHEAGASSDAVLETLRQRFDERLASLQADDAAGRLRSVMDAPARLGGKVKAGAGH
ncbi:type II toxin-antitoxin system prevent-host-death family antitoxin [Lysobacter alkalisoli]|uniref:Type II toxin-antitoxin system prevent-host-death family antitoxin n=2 Tax=Marilutibacter alkalisoli TaxID=2591633 RepID=A0A514BNJ3_9GAMM|nr:type II toxin-antitoxin system prevent-host-death family antitoxin [Lysobacter alkalisoli]